MHVATAGYDCDGDCLIDSDNDQICDQDEVLGCQDDSACNYDAQPRIAVTAITRNELRLRWQLFERL